MNMGWPHMMASRRDEPESGRWSMLSLLGLFYPTLLRYNWHKTLCKFKIYYATRIKEVKVFGVKKKEQAISLSSVYLKSCLAGEWGESHLEGIWKVVQSNTSVIYLCNIWRSSKALGHWGHLGNFGSSLFHPWLPCELFFILSSNTSVYWCDSHRMHHTTAP